jgi:hypothetical protein
MRPHDGSQAPLIPVEKTALPTTNPSVIDPPKMAILIAGQAAFERVKPVIQDIM